MTRPALALLIGLLAACGPSEGETPPPPPPDEGGGGETPPDEESGLVMSDAACTTDADCVPATCCHPSACVAAADAPSCGEVMCTMDCQYGTLDCGGRCLCHEGRCAASLSSPPSVPAE